MELPPPHSMVTTARGTQIDFYDRTSLLHAVLLDRSSYVIYSGNQSEPGIDGATVCLQFIFRLQG